MPTNRNDRPCSRAHRTLRLLLGACLVWLSAMSLAAAQATTTAVPEPVYWRQNLFLIPYQWSSATDPGTADTVRLFVSRDHGVTWPQISEARPQVRAFNYHAESDGEYWFAIRTVDASGNSWPAGPIQPELRVIVDTALPRFDALAGARHDDGTLEVRLRATDANLDPALCTIEVQTGPSGSWQTISAPPMSLLAPTVWEGRTTWTPPPGAEPTAVRATLCDRAGNRAIYQSQIERASAAGLVGGQWPALVTPHGDTPTAAATPLTTDAAGTKASPGWVSISASAAGANTPPQAAVSQRWPAEQSASSVSHAFGNSGQSADSAVTYGTPLGVDPADAARRAPLTDRVAINDHLDVPEPVTDDRPLGDVPTARQRPFQPLEPFRQVSVGRNAEPSSAAPSSAVPRGSPSFDTFPIRTAATPPPTAGSDDLAWLTDGNLVLPAGAAAKLVNSRSFALEYELEETDPWGIARIELWGTHDGGRTWRSYGVDNDHLSPLNVTVDGQGLYGFRIVVEGAGGVGGFPPQAGDRPELWVGVDLQRPQLQLTSVEPGSGDLAGQLVLRWYADDDNLEARPIALFYSSRPAGPWTTIATHLRNSGEYHWRLERHLPRRVHLRLEARDTAGNLAAYQTSEPITIAADPSESGESTPAHDPPMAWSPPTSTR